jgi:hypothetical protein
MGYSAPANNSLIPEPPKGLLTSAECLKIAERKMGEAIGDRRHGKELRATAEAWLVLADKIEQAEALDGLCRFGQLQRTSGPITRRSELPVDNQVRNTPHLSVSAKAKGK